MSNRTSTQSSRASSPIDGGIRKRVGKACDRCRMKKARCDGLTPCGKCKADNSICAYGRRKRSPQDRVYPKGYVEMLEHQQSQLVLGLQELYRRSLQRGEIRDGKSVLPEACNETMPATHDLLSWLGALQTDQHDTSDQFYDDFYMMQAVAMLEDPDAESRKTSFDSMCTRSEVDQSPGFEAAEIREPAYISSFTSCVPHVPLVESPQPLPLNTESRPTALATAESTQIFYQDSLQTTPAELEVLDLSVYDPWTYNADTQHIYAAQAEVFQQPTDISINPYLTLKDWSIPDTYTFNQGLLYA